MFVKLFVIGIVGFASTSSHALTVFNGNVALDASATFDGKVSVTTKRGKYVTSGGEVISTTKSQLEAEKSRAEGYDGSNELGENFTIKETSNGKFKSGSITFDMSYLNSIIGALPPQESTIFTTDKIKITAAMISGGKVEYLKFSAKDWYPETEEGGDTIVDKGIKGNIDFLTGAVNLRAAFKIKSDAAIDKFKFTGDITVPSHVAPPNPIVPPGPGTVVPGVPEVSTWAMMLAGFAGIGFASYRASRKNMAFAA